MTRYTEIIDRLENATGPDRWLDARIDATLRSGTEKMRGTGYEWAWNNFPVWRCHLSAAGMCGVMHDNGDLGLIWDSEKFTASIDTAIALVERMLPGWQYVIWGGVKEYPSFAELRSGMPGNTTSHGKSPSPPIAILYAMFRALEFQEACK